MLQSVCGSLNLTLSKFFLLFGIHVVVDKFLFKNLRAVFDSFGQVFDSGHILVERVSITLGKSLRPGDASRYLRCKTLHLPASVLLLVRYH